MPPLVYALSELEKTKLDNLKLKQQLIDAHKEILTINEKNLNKERQELTNAIITARNIPNEGFDVLLDDIKGKLIAQPKVLPPEPKVLQ